MPSLNVVAYRPLLVERLSWAADLDPPPQKKKIGRGAPYAEAAWALKGRSLSFTSSTREFKSKQNMLNFTPIYPSDVDVDRAYERRP